MRNSDRFLTAFNRIERSIRVIAGVKEHRPFYRVLEKAKKNSPLVRKYESDLRAYADLRNAIVHNRTSTQFVIAEPHKKVVDQIEKIDKMLAKPKLVDQLFKKRVLAFQTTDSLHETLQAVRKQKYTQFSVYAKKEFKGLLTTVGITNWLASSMLGPHLPRRVPKLGDILHHEKMKRTINLLAAFLRFMRRKKFLRKALSAVADLRRFLLPNTVSRTKSY